MTKTKSEVKQIIRAIESVGVEVISYELNKHNKFKVRNPKTGTVRMISVSGSPRAKGRYDIVKSSVKKVFRKEGEIL